MKGTEQIPVRVRWEDGVHIGGTPFWCDSWRAREICFVSCAHAVTVSRHGQLIATSATLTLLDRSDAKHKPLSRLPVSFGRPFTLGTRRIELTSSGHCFGSASLCVDVDGHRVVYGGRINPRGSVLGEPLDPRHCDTLVVSADYGEPKARFPATEVAAQAAAEFAATVIERGGIPVFLVSSPCKGLDVAAGLANLCDDLDIRLHRTIHHAARRLQTQERLKLPSLRRWIGRPTTNRAALVWPLNKRDSLTAADLPPESGVALLSGRALERAYVDNLKIERAIAWSDQAGHDELIEYIEGSGASKVYLTGRHAHCLAQSLNGPRRTVLAMAAPEQMNLF